MCWQYTHDVDLGLIIVIVEKVLLDRIPAHLVLPDPTYCVQYFLVPILWTLARCFPQHEFDGQRWNSNTPCRQLVFLPAPSLLRCQELGCHRHPALSVFVRLLLRQLRRSCMIPNSALRLGQYQDRWSNW